jgi:hypothetical protein
MSNADLTTKVKCRVHDVLVGGHRQRELSGGLNAMRARGNMGNMTAAAALLPMMMMMTMKIDGSDN